MKKEFFLKVDEKPAFKSAARSRAQAERSARLIKLNNGASSVEIIEK